MNDLQIEGPESVGRWDQHVCADKLALDNLTDSSVIETEGWAHIL